MPLITSARDWLDQTPEKGWGLVLDDNTEIMNLVKSAKQSLLLALGTSSGILPEKLLPCSWQAIKDKLETLKEEDGLQVAELIVSSRDDNIKSLLMNFLHVPCFIAYRTKKPDALWQPFCILADDCRGIIGCDRSYRVFDDINVARVAKCVLLSSQDDLVQMGYTTSESESHSVANALWKPDLSAFFEHKFCEEWAKTFTPLK